MAFLLHLRWVREHWTVGGEGGVIGGSGFEGGHVVGVRGGNTKAINRRRMWVIGEIVVIWIDVELRVLIIVIVMLMRLVAHAHVRVAVVILEGSPCRRLMWLFLERVERRHFWWMLLSNVAFGSQITTKLRKCWSCLPSNVISWVQFCSFTSIFFFFLYFLYKYFFQWKLMCKLRVAVQIKKVNAFENINYF